MAKTNLESAGVSSEAHNWHLMLPTSARVSPLTYAAVVATRYVELCRRRQGVWCVGTFARGGIPGLPGGFHTVLWYPDRKTSQSRLNEVVHWLLASFLCTPQVGHNC